MPTASPLQAINIGLRQLNILRVKMPPESLLKSALKASEVSNPELKVSPPEDKSAPAQKALPSPVIITAFIESFESI